MKSVFINFGDGLRVRYHNGEFLRFVFGVDTDKETIEVITLNKTKDIEVLSGCVDE